MLEAAKKKSVQTYDPITEGMGIYLDALNIFIRLVQIIGGNSSSKKQ